MSTLASFMQICNVPSEGFVQLFIFILIGSTSLKCDTPEERYSKICWYTLSMTFYNDTVPVQKSSGQECKDYCEHQLPGCNLVSFDEDSEQCYVKESPGPVVESELDWTCPTVETYILYLECARDVMNCWTPKGDLTFGPDIVHVDRPQMTLALCKRICLTDYPGCDIVVYEFHELTPCWVKSKAGSYDSFRESLGSMVFVLNRTCIELNPSGSPELITSGSPKLITPGSPKLSTSGSLELTTSGSPELTTSGSPELITSGSPKLITSGSLELTTSGSTKLIIRGSPEFIVSGSPNSNGMFFFEKYFMYMLVARQVMTDCF